MGASRPRSLRQQCYGQRQESFPIFNHLSDNNSPYVPELLNTSDPLFDVYE